TVSSNVGNQIRQIISDGVSIINFFGHSAATIYDVEIETPEAYNNWGKYPFMIANGCYSGDFVSTYTFGEKFINEPNRGTIGYLSSSSTGYLTPLTRYNQIFYKRAFGDSLNIPIGEIIRRVHLDSLYDNPSADPYSINHVRQINLQCDPALRLYAPRNPDLEITEASISFSPSDFSAQSDSFQVIVVAKNLGAAFPDSFALQIRQTVLSSGQTITHPIRKYAPILSVDTLQFTIYRSNIDIAGLNTFDIFIDSEEKIAEIREDNNRVLIQTIVPAKVPACMYPREFAIINKDTVSLIAATYNATTTSLINYIFEIDTVYTFNSPMYRSSGVVTGTAWYVAWKVPYQLTDSSVYFWRVRLADEPQILWAKSSFKYIRGPKEGWAQSRPAQFFENPVQRVKMNQSTKKWEFDPQTAKLTVIVTKNQSEDNMQYFLNGDSRTGITPNPNGVMYTVFDRNTLQPIIYYASYDVANAWAEAKTPSELHRVINTIQAMRNGDYFLMVVGRGASVPQWSGPIFQSLADVGVSANFRLTPDSMGVIILGRKGSTIGSAVEVYDFDGDKNLRLDVNMYSNYPSGRILTKLIGPAEDWFDLIWGWYPLEPEPSDAVKVSVIGVQANGQETELITNITQNGSYSLDTIDATIYPFLKLKAEVRDSIFRTSPQLDNWHVYFTPVPECLIDPLANFRFDRDTVSEGENIFVRLTVQNITDLDMDSLLVRYSVRKQNGLTQVLDTIRMRPLPGNQRYAFEYQFNTRGMAGINTFSAMVNPDFDQPEQYLFNNLYTRNFYVIGDKINPILDVTFDGKHIIDGDIVSPKPEIMIQVNDENNYFVLDDTTCVDYVKFMKDGDNPNDPAHRVHFTDSRLQFIPANLPENKAKILFRPGTLPDGYYRLEVMGRDKSGNASGTVNYMIKFRVINESTITNIVNYPNPFSTSTRFVYTLTGSDLPEVFKIQIFTITGKFVKEIDLRETGDVFIGTHITNVAWDGTDEYGDRLANGIYLYKVLLRMPNQQTIKLEDAETKQFFNNGYGKMYLMR
ncbi:MAG: C25 family cysteine peptidase, partial [Bacteroidia bacterium]|nr:C25 family cysteine peptidase [Bacteroidia bacterium]